MLSANSDITTDTENDVSIDVELDAPVTAGDKRSMGSAAPPPPSSVRLAVYHLLRWVRILGFPFVFVLYWVGLWNLLDLYVYYRYAIENGYVWRDALYIAVGLLGLVAVKMTWSEKSSAQRGGVFSWGKEVVRVARLWVTVTLAVVFWTGAWNVIDNAGPATSALRELAYVAVAIPAILLLDVVANPRTLRHMLGLNSVEMNKEGEDFTSVLA